jgi:amino acid transporter
MADSQYDIFETSKEKGGGPEVNVTYIENLEEEPLPGHQLHRVLKSRHITMITVGGTIGTGLILGTYVQI